MTRETKVGLLVGLGIILLIGIVVSDHLSVAQHQNAADLTHFADQAQDSVAPAATEQVRFGQTIGQNQRSARPWRPGHDERPAPKGPAKPLPPPADLQPTNPPMTPQDASPGYFPPKAGRLADASPGLSAPPALSQTQFTSRSSPAGQPPTQTPPAASPTAPPQPVIHYVQAGQSLWQIAHQYYGDGEYWRTIAGANPKAVGAKGAVRAGVRLVIPNKAGLARGNQDDRMVQPHNASGQAVGQTTKERERTNGRYTVQSNDSLSSIASRLLGDANRWEQIYDANRDVLGDPDDIRVGQRLKIPAR